MQPSGNLLGWCSLWWVLILPLFCYATCYIHPLKLCSSPHGQSVNLRPNHRWQVPLWASQAFPEDLQIRPKTYQRPGSFSYRVRWSDVAPLGRSWPMNHFSCFSIISLVAPQIFTFVMAAKLLHTVPCLRQWTVKGSFPLPHQCLASKGTHKTPRVEIINEDNYIVFEPFSFSITRVESNYYIVTDS